MIFITACGASDPAPVKDSVGGDLPPMSYGDYLELLDAKGIDRYMGATPMTQETKGAWEVYRFNDPTGATCLEGTDFVASYRSAASDDVVLYLEGGGACWNYESCYGLPRASKTASDASGRDEGLFDDSRQDNPLRDWNIMYGDYCDGSVWSGDNTIAYRGRRTYHHGLANLSATITMLKQNVPNPSRILVTGSSAGGFGTLMGYLATRTQFPDSEIHVLNDSGPYIENPALRPTMGRDVRDHWQFEQFLPDDCELCDEQLVYIVDWILERDSKVKWGLFSYYDDIVIGTMFLGMGLEYRDLLLQTSGYVHDRHPERFQRYFIEGPMHTILGLPTYYKERDRGVVFAQWVGQFIDDDPAWADLP